MGLASLSKIVELFGNPVEKQGQDWSRILQEQKCVFLGGKCWKVRKSDSATSIGTCSVIHGKLENPIIICPTRLLDKRQVFTDCLHLLTTHEPGNELHLVSEVSIPGGSIDFFLISSKAGRVKDFVGIELQTLDTSGTVWPERQRLLRDLGVQRNDDAENSASPFGMNWKMTAKTTLVQIHHKIQTFEHIHKKLVLVVQNHLFAYMAKEFDFGHLTNPASLGDSAHFHSYEFGKRIDNSFGLSLQSRLSTDANGIGTCLGLQTEARIELELILQTLQAKISPTTLFSPV